MSEEHLPASHRDVHQVSSLSDTITNPILIANSYPPAAFHQPFIIIDRHPGDAGAHTDTLPGSVAGATPEVERRFNQNLQAHK